MKNKITFEEHKIIGMMCKMLNYKLHNSNIEQHHTSKKKSMNSQRLKADDALCKFKNHMENVMYVDFPNEATTSVYYGNRDESGDIIKWLKNELNKKK